MILLLSISLSIQTALATNCNDVIQACEKAIDAKNEQIIELGKGLDLITTQNVELRDIVTTQDKQLSAWYRNPFIMLGLGVIAGGATALVLSK